MCPMRHGGATEKPLWCVHVVEIEKGVKNGPGLSLVIGLALALHALQQTPSKRHWVRSNHCHFPWTVSVFLG